MEPRIQYAKTEDGEHASVGPAHHGVTAGVVSRWRAGPCWAYSTLAVRVVTEEGC